MEMARKPLSLILVTVDCLRADHVGFMGYDRATTPFLDSLAAESLVFPNAIVTGFPTYYSFPSILASRYPLALGRDIVGLAPGEPSLASVLKEARYATAAFNAGNPYVSAQFGYHGGFDSAQDFLDDTQATDSFLSSSRNKSPLRTMNQMLEHTFHSLGPAGAIYDELYFQYCQWLAGREKEVMDSLRRFPAANVVVDQAQIWFSGLGDRPFFLWIHLMDPHGPYYPAEKALAELGHGSVTASRARYLNSFWNRGDLGPGRFRRHLDEVVMLYDAGIRWVDMQVARLIDTLQGFGLWDDVLFVFTADHGEEFLDHGGRFHAPSKLTEELVRVPLLVHLPGIKPRELPVAPFSLLHLVPTLLEMLSIKAPAEFQGRSYLPFLASGGTWDEPAVVECVEGCTNPYRPETRFGPRLLAIREARFKLVIRFRDGSEELFDLQSDPGERSPLPLDQQPEVRRRLWSCARKHLQNSIGQRDLGTRLRAYLRERSPQWLGPVEAGVAHPFQPD
jgi:arylsulfatase A-like enzyme